MTNRMMVLGTVCFALAARPAWGAMIATPPLRQPTGDHVECRVTNVGRTALQITSEGVGPSGAVFASQSANVDAGKTGPTLTGVCNATTCAAYCWFTAKSRKSLRGAILVVSATTNEATASLPAQ